MRFTHHTEAERGRPFVQKIFGLEDDKPGAYTRVDDGWWGIASMIKTASLKKAKDRSTSAAKNTWAASDQGVILLCDVIRNR